MIRPFRNVGELKARLDINDSMWNCICLKDLLTNHVIFTGIISLEFDYDEKRLLKINNWTVDELASHYMAKVNNSWIRCGIEE